MNNLELLLKRNQIDEVDRYQDNAVPGLGRLRARLAADGGSAQEDRMIEHKKKSFEKALLYSYQAAKICKVEEIESGIEYRALINPDKINNDYDVKNLSVSFEYNYKCGDILYWKGTDTYWLVYLKQFTEDAYFRAEIRRCKYQIQWVDTNKEKKSTWAYIRGPVEGKIDSVNSILPLNNNESPFL